MKVYDCDNMTSFECVGRDLWRLQRLLPDKTGRPWEDMLDCDNELVLDEDEFMGAHKIAFE